MMTDQPYQYGVFVKTAPMGCLDGWVGDENDTDINLAILMCTIEEKMFNKLCGRKSNEQPATPE